MAVISSMGHDGYSQAMPRTAGALVVLLMLLATGFSSAGSAAVPRRSLLDLTDKPTTIAVDLMHIQHVNSPYRQPNLTLMERAQISVANSNRRLQTTSVFTSPLNPPTGDYTMEITVGTPARTFVAFADTGSDLVWLQCSTCTNCLQIPDSPFDPTASASYIDMNCTAAPCTELGGSGVPCPSTNICGYNYSYGDLSFTYGNMAYETFTFTSPDESTTPITDVAFGCGTDDESTTFRKTDGLVGLGRGPLSLVSQLGSIIDPVFSYCLVDPSASTTQTSSLLLGSAGAAPKAYTPLIVNEAYANHYYVNLLGIDVNRQPINFPNGTFDIDSRGIGGMIMDSGTTYTTFLEAAYTPFENAISNHISYPRVQHPPFNLCYDTSSESSPVFPTVVFQFENLNVPLSLSNTFMQSEEALYCLAFLAAANNVFNIFGNTQQSNFEIAYDVGNNQVGFNTQLLTC